MPDGGRLRVGTRADGDAVEVIVEDTGSGISEKDLPHIFEAFYTTKPGVTGIGLGLFVSEGIIRGHRGRIDVESTHGAGAASSSVCRAKRWTSRSPSPRPRARSWRRSRPWRRIEERQCEVRGTKVRKCGSAEGFVADGSCGAV